MELKMWECSASDRVLIYSCLCHDIRSYNCKIQQDQPSTILAEICWKIDLFERKLKRDGRVNSIHPTFGGFLYPNCPSDSVREIHIFWEQSMAGGYLLIDFPSFFSSATRHCARIFQMRTNTSVVNWTFLVVGRSRDLKGRNKSNRQLGEMNTNIDSRKSK